MGIATLLILQQHNDEHARLANAGSAVAETFAERAGPAIDTQDSGALAQLAQVRLLEFLLEFQRFRPQFPPIGIALKLSHVSTAEPLETNLESGDRVIG